MRLVEVVVPITAAPDTISHGLAFVEACGKEAVEVQDRAGFVVNALLFPYLNNAMRLLEDQVASMEGIDAAMTGGCGFPMGPFALLDLVGLDTSLAILEALHAERGDPSACPRRCCGAWSRRAGSAASPATASTTTVAETRRGRSAVPERATPWLMRTYSGHSSAAASNALVPHEPRPGPDRPLDRLRPAHPDRATTPTPPQARGEVGRVGVPVVHLGHMERLFEGIPIESMNTSMTINATAPWLLGLYLALAERRGVDPSVLQGTTQNDLVKEFLSRGTYIFGPEPSKRLTVDTIAHTVANVPRWNPINVCSYHLQEAGATPVQELAYALATAIDVLDAVRASGKVDDDDFDDVVARISFFVNAGIRFVEETPKMRAFTPMWDHVCRDRYGVADPSQRRFRYGVQVNSLGLTEQQPENNVQRIVLELLGVTLSADARARAVQLPAWNEALGLPRQADQQWSLRIQQVLAYETDLLEYPDLFAGSLVMEAKTAELVEAAQAELDDVLALGGAFAAIDELKRRLVASQTARVAAIESGEQRVVGVNCFADAAGSPLGADAADSVRDRRPGRRGRARRRRRAVARGARPARGDRRARRAAARRRRRRRRPTTSWSRRSPSRSRAGRPASGRARCARCSASTARRPASARRPSRAARSRVVAARAGARPELAAAAPAAPRRQARPRRPLERRRADRRRRARRRLRGDLPGHPAHAAEIVAAARDEDVDVVGLSVLSGAHLAIVPADRRGAPAAGVTAASSSVGSCPRGRRTRAPSMPASVRCSLRRTSSSRDHVALLVDLVVERRARLATP